MKKSNNRKAIVQDPMAVTWMEKYSDTIDKYWSKLPGFVGTVIASLAVFILGATMRGKKWKKKAELAVIYEPQ